MTKIAFIGAGSTVFAKNLIGDILSFPELADSTLSLMDIDPERLRTSEIVAHKVADFFGVKPEIEATLDRRQALDGADYAISMFQVGGYKPSTVIEHFDFAIIEDAFYDGWAEVMKPFIEAGKPVFAAEYTDLDGDFHSFCQNSQALKFNTILKNRDLDAWIQTCE